MILRGRNFLHKNLLAEDVADFSAGHADFDAQLLAFFGDCLDGVLKKIVEGSSSDDAGCVGNCI